MTVQIGDSSRIAPLLKQQGHATRNTLEPVTLPEDGDAFVRADGGELGLMDRARLQTAQQSGPRPRTMALSSPQEALERYEDVRGSGDPEELKQIRQELLATHKALRTGEISRETHQDTSRLAMALGDVKQSLGRIREADREARWDKVTAGLDAPPSSTYKAYFTHSDVPIKEMKQVLAAADDLAKPDSSRRIPGNQVDTLPRDRIWATKMDLLEGAATQPVRDGRPVEIDAEYFELSSPQYIDKLNRAAAGGASVRVLVDSGRLQPGPEGTQDASSLAGRLNTLARLQDGNPEGASRPAVALFANDKMLGSRADLMHRKLLRVGDEVVFGGMNANQGSGENVDFAMKVRGPATGHFVDTFRKDVDASAGATSGEVFGTQMDDLRKKPGGVTLDRQGMRDFIGALSADAGIPAGLDGDARLGAQLDALDRKGIDITRLAAFPDSTHDGKVDRMDVARSLGFQEDGHAGHLRLTGEGRDQLASQLEARVERTRAPENVAALRDISEPSSRTVAGADDTLAIADDKIERQAAVLQAIDGADRFVKVSAFVVTKDIASALIAKRDAMAAQGRPFDVQVALDPGLYGFGSTPNTTAYKMLEDAGIEVRWNLLDRTDPGHDRKNHSKLIITDQQMIAGSTNFSKKGLRENWEMSDVTWFGDDAASRASQKQVVDDYDRTWARETVALDTRALADRHGTARPGALPSGEPGRAEQEVGLAKDAYRDQVLKRFLRGIESYEREAGVRIQAEARDPKVAAGVAELESRGIAHGYAVLDTLGPERLQEIRESRPAYRTLLRIQERGLE